MTRRDPWRKKVWDQAILDLKAMASIGPVSVRRVAMPDNDFGYVRKNGRGFDIRVATGLTMTHSLYVLTHEWAHAMVWSIYKRRDSSHTAHFGIAWAETYRIIFEEGPE